MGKLDASRLRFLSDMEFRILVAIEMGMRNHEVVPSALAASIASLRQANVSKILRDLVSQRLLSYERTAKKEGYRLSNQGYDFLALKTLVKKGAISSFGNEIGVGKESDIYTAENDEQDDLVVKIHRLGRTSFRSVKNKRDYLGHKRANNWIYMSRVSASKEFLFMQALHNEGFSIPKPIECNRHCIVMEHIDGELLNAVYDVVDPSALFDELMHILIQFASIGIIHGDFNEFNILLTKDDKPVIIDFPQIVSTFHANAEMYFERDVKCIRLFFEKRFNIECNEYPKLAEIVRTKHLDCTIKCSGYRKKLAKETGVPLDGDIKYDESDCEDNETDVEKESDLDEQDDGKNTPDNLRTVAKLPNKNNMVEYLIDRMDLLNANTNEENSCVEQEQELTKEENDELEEIPSEAAAIDPLLRKFTPDEVSRRIKLEKIQWDRKMRNKKIATKSKTSLIHKARKKVKESARENYDDWC